MHIKRHLLSIIGLFCFTIFFAEEVTFDFTNPTGLTPSVAPNSDGTQETHISGIRFTENGVALVATKGSTTESRIWTSTGGTYELRMYKGATLTISSLDGSSITHISLQGNATAGFTQASVGNIADGTWSGDANSITLTIANNASTQKITSVIVGTTNTPTQTTVHYDVVDGLKGKNVKTALMGAIDEHTQRSYSNLWTDFYTTDRRPDGKVWDMYSSVTNYIFGDDQSKGGDSGEGSSYNREHSMPKSWFGGEVYPMYTDLFHLYPTDSYINQMRNNYPYGEVNTIKKQSQNGHSKLGTSAASGYSGTVFEPADEYKGDLARTYFYMATRYENQIATWDSDMLAGNAYPAFTSWALQTLLKWHREDPVSEKEISRNEAVYAIQHNRNPYIDYPVFAELVWGELTDVTIDISKLVLHSNDYDTTDSHVGHLTTPHDNMAIYDLTGRQVKNPTRGIYIINGKKAIVGK